MARVDLRVRLLGRALALTSISRMNDDQIARAQKRHVGHNRVLDLLLGGVASGASLRDDTVAGATGATPARVYRPADAGDAVLPLVVNFHGGGWVQGTLDQSDWLCSNVAATVRCVVVSVDYRLRPLTAGRRQPRTATTHWWTSRHGRMTGSRTGNGWR